MKRVSIYTKLRVLGAVDSTEGNTIKSRIQKVAQRTFHDEEGLPHVFKWRTIQTWYSLAKQGGVEMLENRPRKDKGQQRKVSPEALAEAIERVLPEFREDRYNKMMIYRRCIERGTLSRQQCSQTSFFRLVKEYDLLTPPTQTNNKRRLAFSKRYANEMWQLDTMFGPHIKIGGRMVQTKLIAFIDDDVLLEPAYLAEIERAFRAFDDVGMRKHADAVFVPDEELASEVREMGIATSNVIIDPIDTDDEVAHVARHLDVYRKFMAQRGTL